MPTEVLAAEGVHLGRTAADLADAIDQCGQALLALGAVTPEYLPAMHEREAVVSTFVGEGFAIPHGTDEARAYVRQTRLAFLQFPHGVDWNGNDVRACIAIAATGAEHVTLLSRLAATLLEPDSAAALREATDARTVLGLLHSTETEEENPA